MSHNWKEIYWWKTKRVNSENKLARPIPFGPDFQKNVNDTLEWLVRYRRSNETFAQEKPFVLPIRDGWFTQEHAPGMFYHVCDPRALLKFRSDYENAFRLLTDYELQQDAPHGLTVIENSKAKCVETRIAMWGVVGRDGFMQTWYIEYDDDFQEKILDNIGIAKFYKDGIGYRWFCHKCIEKMPKGIQAQIKLGTIK